MLKTPAVCWVTSPFLTNQVIIQQSNPVVKCQSTRFICPQNNLSLYCNFPQNIKLYMHHTTPEKMSSLAGARFELRMKWKWWLQRWRQGFLQAILLRATKLSIKNSNAAWKVKHRRNKPSPASVLIVKNFSPEERGSHQHPPFSPVGMKASIPETPTWDASTLSSADSQACGFCSGCPSSRGSPASQQASPQPGDTHDCHLRRLLGGFSPNPSLFLAVIYPPDYCNPPPQPQGEQPSFLAWLSTVKLLKNA